MNNADSAALLLRRSEVRCEGNKDLRDNSSQTDKKAGGDHWAKSGRQSGSCKGDRDSGEKHDHQATAADEVAQGNEERHAYGVADLSRGSDEANLTGARVEGMAHIGKYGLIVVKVRDGYARSDGKGPAQARCEIHAFNLRMPDAKDAEWRRVVSFFHACRGSADCDVSGLGP